MANLELETVSSLDIARYQLALRKLVLPGVKYHRLGC